MFAANLGENKQPLRIVPFVFCQNVSQSWWKAQFWEVVNCINLTLTRSFEGSDTHPSRTAKLDSENRFIERVVEKYAGCLDANDIFRCLETLSTRKTNLSIDLDEIGSRVALSDPEDADINLEAPPESDEQQPPSPAH